MMKTKFLLSFLEFIFLTTVLEVEYFALGEIDRTQEKLIAENLIKTSPLHPGILRAELGL